jgi:hypothetical protein
MEKIVAIGYYTLLRERGNESKGSAVFQTQVDNDLVAEVSIDNEANSVVSKIRDVPVSEGFTEALKGFGRFDRDKLSDKYEDEVVFIARALSAGTKKVVSLIKYYLRHAYIKESLFSVKGVKWGPSEDSLSDLPSGIRVSSMSMSSEPLRENTIKNIQAALDNNMEPLMAMRHLHRARLESMPHHRWIDATIAAELAVKEVLAIAKPELEQLLMEVPSPPLDKLYGSILETYMGERSPYLKFIREGVKVRNKLIHRPYAEKIDPQAAIDYVEQIEGAIFHLLHMLYPKDKLIEKAYLKCQALTKCSSSCAAHTGRSTLR